MRKYQMGWLYIYYLQDREITEATFYNEELKNMHTLSML